MIRDLEERYGAHNYRPLEVVIERAQGVWLFDIDGKRYLDCVSAYSAVSQGHCHPRIAAAAIAQAQKVTLTSRAMRNDKLGPFLERLVQICGYETALPMNTGVEAVETAIKLARRYAYERRGIARDSAEIVVFQNNFHGRTTTAISASSTEAYRQDFGPFMPGFVSIPFGDITALRNAIGPCTCAILIEPIQGEGGVIVPPPGFLSDASRLCREQRILFMADEIQTGFGRTGDLFACDHENVKPDVLIVGKALGGGYYPVSAILASRELMELFGPGDHGSTFGGNPLAAAIALEAINVIVEEDLAARARRAGERLVAALRHLASPAIREIRGRGLLIGLELKTSARELADRLLELGVVAKDTHAFVLRIAPPLIISDGEIDFLVSVLSEALQASP